MKKGNGVGKSDFAVVWDMKGKSEKISGIFGSFPFLWGVGIEKGI